MRMLGMIAKSICANNRARDDIGHAENKMSAALIGKRDNVLVDLIERERVACRLELKTLAFRTREPPCKRFLGDRHSMIVAEAGAGVTYPWRPHVQVEASWLLAC